MSQEMMKFYQKEKINPLGGCLPMLVQLPIWLSLYWVLIEAVEIRQMPWMFWIEDLATADPYFILPVLMGVTMYFQMQMTMTANMDPMQQKMFKYMPIAMTAFFVIIPIPSGLLLYWVANNLLTIGQQALINRDIAKAEEIEKAEYLAKKKQTKEQNKQQKKNSPFSRC